jgi:mRNA-degrading endonuclease RelE of RelBE toxin-antitoxin system
LHVQAGSLHSFSRVESARPNTQAGREALLDKVEAFAATPYAGHPATIPLRRDQDLVRLRQGDWRWICRVDRAADTVVLETVAHRREVCR